MPTNPLDKVVARVDRWLIPVCAVSLVVVAAINYPFAESFNDWFAPPVILGVVAFPFYYWGAYLFCVMVIWIGNKPSSLRKYLTVYLSMFALFLAVFALSFILLLPAWFPGSLFSVIGLTGAAGGLARYWHRHLMREEGE